MRTKIITIKKNSTLSQYDNKEISWITDEPEVLEFARRLVVEGVIKEMEVEDFVEEDY